MSLRYNAGFIRPGYNPLRVPNAPTIGTATDSKTDGTVTVAFTAPSCVGGGAITGYTAVANCGAKFASGSSSPITVTGLTNCTAYTFKVYANNTFGPSAYSAASNSVTPTKIATGQQAYTTAGTYTWVAPTGVTSVSVVAVGGGGGGGRSTAYCAGYAGSGGGGGLGYKNNISVTPGNSYTVFVGAGGAGATSGNCGFSGARSYFCGPATVAGCGGSGGLQYSGGGGGPYTGAGGGSGGAGGYCGGWGGGGAGGYAGNGGSKSTVPTGGGGGAGGQAMGYWCSCFSTGAANGGGAGGGVGILGQGASGVNGGASVGKGGTGGSSGCNGATTGSQTGGTGGKYGGGGGQGASLQGVFGNGGAGGGGAVRIIWPGSTRKFPSTCTGDK